MTNARKLPRPRLLFAIALWVLALIPVVLVLIGLSDSSKAIAWSKNLQAGSQYVTAVIIGGSLLAILLYPPAVPTVRLAFARSKARLSVDQGPAAQALERIEHLPTSRDHLIVGNWALDTGDLQRAATHLMQAISLDPASIPAHFALAEVARKSGNVEVALTEYLGVVQREPDHAYGRALLGLAKSFEASGQEQQAIETYARYEQMHGESREAWVAQARLLQKHEQTEAARELFERAAAEPDKGKLSPEEAYWRAKARVALKTGARR